MEIEFDISHGIVLKHTNNISIQLMRIFANVLEISFPFFRFYGEYVSLFDYNSFHVYGNVETCITSILILKLFHLDRFSSAAKVGNFMGFWT